MCTVRVVNWATTLLFACLHVSAGTITPGTEFLSTPAGGACLNFSTANHVCNGGGGDIPLTGVPVTGLPPGTDTVARHGGSLQPGQTGILPFELLLLNLKSVAPVDLTPFGGSGVADMWVRVNNINASNAVYDVLLPSTGMMTVTQNPAIGAGGPIVFHTSFTVFADLIFTHMGGDPNNPGDVVFHTPADPAQQDSDQIQAGNTPDYLPGRPINPLPPGTVHTFAEPKELNPEPPGDEIFIFTLPFATTSGDVVLGEFVVPDLNKVAKTGVLDISDWSDRIRFSEGPSGTTIVTFYSDPLSTRCPNGFRLEDQPTYPGSPHSHQVQVPCHPDPPPLSANAVGIKEFGTELGNSAVYRPGNNVTYIFISDVPEPATFGLFGTALLAGALLRRRRRR